jgi:hypothetical protein
MLMDVGTAMAAVPSRRRRDPTRPVSEPVPVGDPVEAEARPTAASEPETIGARS